GFPSRRNGGAGAITPVPGGAGPMTIAMLMQNTLRAALLKTGRKPSFRLPHRAYPVDGCAQTQKLT
ncbi:MAG: hypothetical protein WBG11_11595, partial [Methylocella sp.]